MLPPGTATKYVEYVKRFRFAILALWIVLDILGLIYGLRFLDATTTEFVAPPGSEAVKAEDKLIKYFPQEEQVRTAVVYVEGLNGLSVFDGDLGNSMFEFSRDLCASVQDANVFVSCSSYYSFMDQDLPLLAANFRTNASNSDTYISVRYDGSEREDSMDFIDKIHDKVREYRKQLNIEHTTRMRETGVDYFQKDTLEGTSEDMETMDTIVLPIALFILACVIQNLPIMFVPLITIFTTVLVEFLFMYPIALAMDVVAFVPSFMMSLTFAMSIDYSLFMLSRFCEEHRHRKPVLTCIELMLESAGGTIAVSGGTLMICFLGLIFIPMDLIRSVGVGSAFVLAVAIVANITLTPALLIMSEPVVFWIHRYINFEKLPWNKHSRLSGDGAPLLENDVQLGGFNEKAAVFTTPLMMVDTSDDLLRVTHFGSRDAPAHGHEHEDMEEVQKSFWYQLGAFLLKPWYGLALFLVVIALSMPINIHCLNVKTTISFDAMVPHSANSFKAYKAIGQTFGQGTVMPYRILFVNRDETESIFSDSAYQRVQAVITEMVQNLDYTDYKDFVGSVIIDSDFITYQETVDAMNDPNPDSTEQTYVILASTYNSPPDDNGIQRATYAMFTLETDPYSLDGIDWLNDCRDLLDSLQKKHNLDLYLVYGATVTYDAVQAVYDVFPIVITVTLVVVFVFMAIAFLSIVAPLRLVGTIVLTLTFCYGLAVLVYQHGAFEWMRQRPFDNYDALDWLPPIMCFSIVVGLGLDYDVFLVGRVLEYRLAGYTSDGSILKGLYKTGHIITAAGIIMAVAFSGLFLSEALILNQVAFFLVFAVLLDTFVVRTVLVPILMGVAGKHAWWPRPNVPDGTDTYGFQE